MKPPVGYCGAKVTIAEEIAALFPGHEHYVEPYCGGLAVLLAKPASAMETINDLDGDVMTFWRVLRDRPQDLERVCSLTPHSRAEQRGAYLPAIDELEQARRVWIRLTQSRGNHVHAGRFPGWRHYQDARGRHASMPGYLQTFVTRIAPAAARLAGVSLECRPALDVIDAYGRAPGTLIYADPPYLGSARTWNRGGAYSHDMRSPEAHRELAAALAGCAAAVVLSGYRSPLYDDLYDGWYQAEIGAYAGNGVPGDQARTEVLWSNRPFADTAPTLFGLEATS